MTEQNISISPVYTTADQLVDTLTLSEVKMPQVDVKLPDVTGISAEESAVKTIMGNWVLLPDYVDYDNLSIENFNELEGVDDAVAYKNNKTVGKTADKKAPVVVIKGKGNYKGTMEFTFNILPADISGFSKDADAPSVLYRNTKNNYVTKPVIKDINGGKLVPGKDYELVEYKVYNEDTASLAAQKPDGTQVLNSYLKVVSAPGSCKFTGKDIRPEDIVLQDIGGYRLVKGVDYTLSYKNNKNAFTYVAGTNEAKAPAVIVNGKGNYTGKLCLYFSIMQADISGTDNKGNPRITVSAPDVLYRDVKNNYIPKITVTDAYGKKLTVGKDYDKNVQYKLVSTGSIVSGDRVSMGTKTELLMEAVIVGTGNYTGSYTFRYRIYSADIKTAAVGKKAMKSIQADLSVPR